MEDYLLVTQDLTKVYKETVAADRVNIHIKKGSIYGLIGKNGAGKTTRLQATNPKAHTKTAAL